MNVATATTAWVQGWVASRKTSAAVNNGAYLTVQVDATGHLIRHVFPILDASAFCALVRSVAAPGTWIKVAAPRESVEPLLTPDWRVHEREYLMQSALPQRQPLPPHANISFKQDAAVIVGTLVAANGDLAARAQAAVVDGVAVFDQVVTESQHRRKGYGALLMTHLAEECRAVGATAGVLVATEDGKHLYSALGWANAAEVTAVSYGVSQ